MPGTTEATVVRFCHLYTCRPY